MVPDFCAIKSFQSSLTHEKNRVCFANTFVIRLAITPTEYCGVYGRDYSNGSAFSVKTKDFKNQLLPHHCQVICAMFPQTCVAKKWNYDMTHGKMECKFWKKSTSVFHFRNNMYQGGMTSCEK